MPPGPFGSRESIHKDMQMDRSISRRRVHPALEGLEGRSLLSSPGYSAGFVAPPAQVAPAVAGRIVLDGIARGTVRPWLGPTTGGEPAFVLTGIGQHATIGRARVDGFMMPTRVEGNPFATLTLKARRGSVTLALEAPLETLGRPALVYRYTVQHGTGDYRGVTGTGTAYLSLPRGLSRGLAATTFTFLLRSDRTGAEPNAGDAVTTAGDFTPSAPPAAR